MERVLETSDQGCEAIPDDNASHDRPGQRRKIAVPQSWNTAASQDVRPSEPSGKGIIDARSRKDRNAANVDAQKAGTKSTQSSEGVSIPEAPISTVSPPRIITVEHESKPRLAMLLTDELVEAWRSACEHTRRTEGFTQQAEARRDVLVEFLRSARFELSELPDRRRLLEDDPSKADELRDLWQLSQELRSKIEQAKQRQAEDCEEVARLEMMVSNSEYEFEIGPDQAFLENFTTPVVQDRVIKQPAPVRAEYTRSESAGNAILATVPDLAPAEVASKPSAEYVIEQEFKKAYHHLRHAQTKFDHRERGGAPATSRLGRREGVSAVEERLQHDLKQLERNRNVTRELINAEERFAAARKTAVDHNLDLMGSAQTSGFGHIDGDLLGARLSHTRPVIEGAPKNPDVLTWIDSVPDEFCYVIDPHQKKVSSVRKYKMQVRSWAPPPAVSWPPGEIHQAGNTPAIRPEDSCSMVDYGRKRKRIDQVDASRGVFRDKVIQHWQKHTSCASANRRPPDWSLAHATAGEPFEPML